ncbi:endo-1,3-1,4-beta-glycanase [Paenibacillus pasadenensis]|uniref:Endo-1,3-1,4-beta-glycanase n=2 Tax=Paenibacillus pasadenensis TaxID=217090 RepID=A0A2N5N1L5_9BACL|nr:endo-1,3-1,4-beta-glycanase [Paenibacillus pasadenensis]
MQIMKKRAPWIKGTALALSLAMLFGFVPAPASAESPGEELPEPALSASYTYHGDNLAHVADGIVSYNDAPKNRWTSYESPNSSDWIEFDFGGGTTRDAAAVYLFSDGGGVTPPQALDVQAWDGTEWNSVAGLSAQPAEPAGNELNLLRFDPVQASKFRIVFTHSGSKSGATEIQLFDSSTEALPGAELAPLGIVSASYTFRLDQVSHVNDGIVSYGAKPANRWTSYESPNASDWVQSNFGVPVRKDAAGLFLYADGGGVQAPASYDIQYQDSQGAWVSAEEQVKTPAEPAGNTLNTVRFKPVTAQKFRVVLVYGAAKAGMTEIQYVDSFEQSLPAEPDSGVASASYTNGGDAIAQLNDDIVSYTDFPRNRWTSYGSPNAQDWVQIHYGSVFSKDAAGLYFFDDGGGVVVPQAYELEYWDGSAWQPAPNQIREPASPTADTLNLVRFDPVMSDRFRIVLTHAGAARSGMTELKLVDTRKEPMPDNPPPVERDPELEILAPAIGSSVQGEFELAFKAPGMKNIEARVWHQPDADHEDPSGYSALIGQAVPNEADEAALSIDADKLPHGPLTIVLQAWDSAPGDPDFVKSARSYVQLYNEGGVVWNNGIPDAAPPQAEGMDVVFEDDFNGPLSVSRTGEGAKYAAIKPDWPNGSEFGEAIFADPAGSVNPFAVLGENFLRIRASKAPADYADPQGWHREHVSGLLSSVRVDGSGFAATNGYFEARIQMPAGKGAWPAFWLMSQDSTGASGRPSTAEIDIVEGYGHNPQGVCQAKHWWAGQPETHGTSCLPNSFSFGDSASTWHLYGAKVTKSEVIYYIDNIEVWRHDTFEQANTPLYFMLNLALGGGWPIDLAQYGDQLDMYVDYVRVFEPKKGEATPTPSAGASPTPTPSASASPTPTPSASASPTPTPTPSVENGTLRLPLSGSVKDGAWTAGLAPEAWAQLLKQSDGLRSLVLDAQQAATSDSYSLELPAALVDGSRAGFTTSILLPGGMIAVPGSLGASGGLRLTLSIGPTLQLRLESGGNPFAVASGATGLTLEASFPARSFVHRRSSRSACWRAAACSRSRTADSMRSGAS